MFLFAVEESNSKNNFLLQKKVKGVEISQEKINRSFGKYENVFEGISHKNIYESLSRRTREKTYYLYRLITTFFEDVPNPFLNYLPLRKRKITIKEREIENILAKYEKFKSFFMYSIKFIEGELQIPFKEEKILKPYEEYTNEFLSKYQSYISSAMKYDLEEEDIPHIYRPDRRRPPNPPIKQFTKDEEETYQYYSSYHFIDEHFSFLGNIINNFVGLTKTSLEEENNDEIVEQLNNLFPEKLFLQEEVKQFRVLIEKYRAFENSSKALEFVSSKFYHDLLLSLAAHQEEEIIIKGFDLKAGKILSLLKEMKREVLLLINEVETNINRIEEKKIYDKHIKCLEILMEVDKKVDSTFKEIEEIKNSSLPVLEKEKQIFLLPLLAFGFTIISENKGLLKRLKTSFLMRIHYVSDIANSFKSTEANIGALKSLSRFYKTVEDIKESDKEIRKSIKDFFLLNPQPKEIEKKMESICNIWVIIMLLEVSFPFINYRRGLNYFEVTRDFDLLLTYNHQCKCANKGIKALALFLQNQIRLCEEMTVEKSNIDDLCFLRSLSWAYISPTSEIIERMLVEGAGKSMLIVKFYNLSLFHKSRKYCKECYERVDRSRKSRKKRDEHLDFFPPLRGPYSYRGLAQEMFPYSSPSIFDI